MKLSNLTLEMSLKPFKDTSDETMDAVIASIFRQWENLYKNADQISIMLWTADGSEILDYNKNLGDKFEWCKYLGGANPRYENNNDPDCRSIHTSPRLYIKDPPEFDYQFLKRLVSKLKSKGQELSGKPIKLIETFDPGPEFAKSSFKYERHNEICKGDTGGKKSFICCYAALNGDSHPYAAYPDGIPDGTSFGEFLGRQAQEFLSDIGFDAIWFSNGLGFGLETWAYKGALFDGSKFMPEMAPQARASILEFWRDFTTHCKYPIQTRGTNLPTGNDLASDATPIREIYRIYKPSPPPNSPWAAIDGNFGIEIGGWMSHIAEIPDDKSYLFRFYAHDPWWINSPWLDRYNREFHDIYLPLSVARINAAGEMESPDSLSILSIDNSYGEMPDKVPNEITPFILDALENTPDQPGPLVWIYPFDEIHDLTTAGKRLDKIFFGDWFVCGAINEGLPLNTVISTANFINSLASNPGLFNGSILFAPAATISQDSAQAICHHVETGGKAILYGPVSSASEKIKNLLCLDSSFALDGELDISLFCEADNSEKGLIPTKTVHSKILSGGGLEEGIASEGASSIKILASARQGAETRVLAHIRSEKAWNGGLVAWIRGAVSGKAGSSQLLTAMSPERVFFPEILPRFVLRELGWTILFNKYKWADATPISFISRHKNAFMFSGFVPNTTVEMELRTPDGAPVFTGLETIFKNGVTSYKMPKSWRRECRVFIDQKEEACIKCKEATSEEVGIKRRIFINGLKDAKVVFYPETGAANKTLMLLDSPFPWVTGTEVKFKKNADKLITENISGTLMIAW